MKHVQFCSGSYSLQYFSPCSSNIFIGLVELLQSLVIKRTALREHFQLCIGELHLWNKLKDFAEGSIWLN